jgi:hypothetical protein
MRLSLTLVYRILPIGILNYSVVYGREIEMRM